MDVSLMASGKAGGCVFQRAKCMGVHFAGAYFMSLPLQVLTTPEVRLITTILLICIQIAHITDIFPPPNRRRRRTSSSARSARWRPCRRNGSWSQTRPSTGAFCCASNNAYQHQLPTKPTKFPHPRSALLVACIRGGETNCHRSDAVRLMKELTALGIKPNAITYGQYTRAIAEGEFSPPDLFVPLFSVPTPT